MPIIMVIMHAYGRFIHRPEPRTWTGMALLPPIEVVQPSARPEAVTRTQ